MAAIGLASAGCTMCPDPFDYSGPVPNGSSPQNDFRARSNGILPLGAAPRPWPVIVRGGNGPSRQPGNEPTPMLADGSAAGATGGEELQQTVAVMGESGEETGADVLPETAADAAGSNSAPLEPVPVDIDRAEPLQGDVSEDSREDPAEEAAALTADHEARLGVFESPVGQIMPPVQRSETPGWRARRR